MSATARPGACIRFRIATVDSSGVAMIIATPNVIDVVSSPISARPMIRSAMYPRTAPPAAASAVSTTRCTRLNARNEFFAAHAVSRGQRCAMSAVFSGRPLLKSSASDAPCDSATSRHETASGSRVVACRASSCSSVPPANDVRTAPPANASDGRKSAAAGADATRDAPRLRPGTTPAYASPCDVRSRRPGESGASTEEPRRSARESRSAFGSSDARRDRYASSTCELRCEPAVAAAAAFMA